MSRFTRVGTAVDYTVLVALIVVAAFGVGALVAGRSGAGTALLVAGLAGAAVKVAYMPSKAKARRKAA